MKKLLLLVLVVLFLTVFSACSEGTGSINSAGNVDNSGEGSNKPSLTKPVISDIKTLNGSYDIEFYYANIPMALTITNDCSLIQDYVINGDNCSNPETDSVEFNGEGIIKVLDNGSVKVQTKMQMNGRIFQGVASMMISQYKFIFNDYNLVPANAVSKVKVNDISTGNSVKGIKGRNAISVINYNDSSLENDDGAGSTFELEVLSDGTIVSTVYDTSSNNALNIVIRMKKKSDEVMVLEANTPYEMPVIDNFNKDIEYIPSNE